MKIDKNIHYFALMHPIEYSFFGIALVDGNVTDWVECYVDESRYKIDDGYKITLRPINTNYSYQDFYQSDFRNLITDKRIIPKTSENMEIKHIKEINKSGNCTYITEYDIVI